MSTVGAGCETPAEHAESATVHALLNCYLREVGDAEVVPAERAPVLTDADAAVRFPLPRLGLDLLVGLRYESPTGRHLFDPPVRALPAADGRPDGGATVGGRAAPARDGAGAEAGFALDAGTLAALLCRDLALAGDGGDGDGGASDDLLARVLDSERNVARYVAARADDAESLYGLDLPFREAEQSLLYGHLLHPTPKSRRGIDDRDAPTYAPELGGSFALHYFRADPSLLVSDSALDVSAVEWVKEELRGDDAVPASFVSEHVESDDALVPLHPWQAEHLRGRPDVEAAVDEGRLVDLGRRGREYYPTTSVRTVYSPESSFMQKGSLAVEITNAERTNKRPELERGVAVAELLDTELGADLRRRFPAFDVIRDPAYLTLDLGDDPESGFEVVLRENPFRGDDALNATPVVSLCQDGIDGPSRLARIVRAIADREGRSTEAASREWFRRYLDVSIRPALWLYLARGVGVEAHQQNGVVRLEEGYPAAFHYRDNQGYYFPESKYDEVDALLPGVGERADTICPDAVADERLRYYLIVNNAFGVINAFGVAGLVDERDLLALLRDCLRDLKAFDRPSSSLLDDLLEARRIPSKANLLTRFEGLDELVGSLENQSVYAEIPNPIVTELEATR